MYYRPRSSLRRTFSKEPLPKVSATMMKHLNRVMIGITSLALALSVPVASARAFEASMTVDSLSDEYINKSVYETLPLVNKSELKLSAFYQFPIRSKDYKGISTEFSGNHPGIDIRGNLGAEITPIYSGEVVGVGYQTGGYGNYVIVAHETGITTLYAHMLKKPIVQIGQRVTQSTVLGLLGSTGRSTGPHIHFEVNTSKGYINPSKILPPVVVGAISQ